MSLRTLVRRVVTGGVATVVAATGLTAGSAAATTDAVTHFDITYGATYFVGDVTWFNRSVSVDGSLRGLSGTGCRSVLAQTWIPSDIGGTVLDERSTSLVCNAVVVEHIPLDADVVGGAGTVEIYLRDTTLDQWGNPHVVKMAYCTRTAGCKYIP